ncbi:hypothetical protein [Pseudomonas aeruginosa]|uniref:hypothetical protein n=1 Tax=Pseudomonas aeruginosa TaxID=287 RepID=UPI0013720FBE|nr:hypothetical protein [Pseudomonas aeruginosa]MZY44676.1 hypothetical protein [Pseudomonas aeruginosa]
MKIDRISIGLDWMHARLPRAARTTFRIAAVLLAIGAIHVFAASLIDAYTVRVLEQFARAEAERSMLALPLGHILGILGVLAFLFWVSMVLMRIFLGLRARLWRRVGQ